MALETRLNPVHGINRYLYEKGKEAGVFSSETVYGGRSPFAPVDQIATFSTMRYNNDSVPFIVYNWATPRIGSDWFMQEEQIIYLVYSNKLEEIRKISNFIVDTMRQYERSATNVQAWLEKLPITKWGGLDHNPYTSLELYSINVENANGPSPIEQGNGRMEALITVNVTFGILNDFQAARDEL